MPAGDAHHIPTKSSIWPVPRQVDLRMTENRHWLNQVVTPATATAPGVASLLEQTDTSPGTWHAATCSGKCLLLHLCVHEA